MRIKNLTLGLYLLLSGSALAQHQLHTVKPGDTLTGIAGMFQARVESILKANGLPKNAHLTAGMALVVPNSTVFAQDRYAVRNGDCDWTIARKFNTSVHKLHLANPAVRDWDALRNGSVLRVPGAAVATTVAAAPPKPSARPHSVSTRPFLVSEDDNDWIIAHHLGVSLHLIHELNPGVNWNRLRAGKHILVPGAQYSEGARVAQAGSKNRVRINRIRTRYAVINSEAVSIRRDAGARARKITTVDTGTRVVVLDRDGAWYKLRFPRGTEGWVRGDFLNPSSHAPAGARRRHHIFQEDRVASRVRRRHHHATPEVAVSLDSDAKSNPIIRSAVAMRGTRYSLGASSRGATDCSGLTWQVYARQGIHLPRTSGEQAHVGMPVKTNDLKPGDLLFFSSRRSSRVHHVAIYVGHNKFIHASSGGGKVQYNSLNEAYYSNHYKGARRVTEPSKRAKHSTTRIAGAEHVSHSVTADTNPTPLSR